MLKTDKFALRLLVWAGAWGAWTLTLAGGCLALGGLIYSAVWLLQVTENQLDWFLPMIILLFVATLIAAIFSWAFKRLWVIPQHLEHAITQFEQMSLSRKKKRGKFV